MHFKFNPCNNSVKYTLLLFLFLQMEKLSLERFYQSPKIPYLVNIREETQFNIS